MKKRLTIFKGEAVHDGHPIEPVLVAGVSHREDARAITQQCALQPAGDVACNRNVVFLLLKQAVRIYWWVNYASKVLLPLTSALRSSGLSTAFTVKFVVMLTQKWQRAEASV